jgi:hypothetical protein
VGLLKQVPLLKNWPAGQAQIPLVMTMPLVQVVTQAVPFHWVLVGHWQT